MDICVHSGQLPSFELQRTGKRLRSVQVRERLKEAVARGELECDRVYGYHGPVQLCLPPPLKETQCS